MRREDAGGRPGRLRRRAVPRGRADCPLLRGRGRAGRRRACQAPVRVMHAEAAGFHRGDEIGPRALQEAARAFDGARAHGQLRGGLIHRQSLCGRLRGGPPARAAQGQSGRDQRALGRTQVPARGVAGQNAGQRVGVLGQDLDARFQVQFLAGSPPMPAIDDLASMHQQRFQEAMARDALFQGRVLLRGHGREQRRQRRERQRQGGRGAGGRPRAARTATDGGRAGHDGDGLSGCRPGRPAAWLYHAMQNSSNVLFQGEGRPRRLGLSLWVIRGGRDRLSYRTGRRALAPNPGRDPGRGAFAPRRRRGTIAGAVARACRVGGPPRYAP